MQRYMPTFFQAANHPEKWAGMKEDSDGDWYHRADVDARAKIEDEVNGKLRERIEQLRNALKAIAAFEVGEFRGLEEEIAIHRIATQALALMER